MTAEFTVVGGGIGGLVVARRLAMAGRSVTLLEASHRLGGTVAAHIVGGVDLDAGAESFAVRGGTVAALASMRVPPRSSRSVSRIAIGTRASRHGPIERGCSTFAPDAASSSISSEVIELILRARETTRGSVV